jgi:hypothetical protein
VSGTGQLLANVGTVIGLEKGPLQDEFFVSFERIGSHSHSFTEPALVAPAAPPDAAALPDIGLRTFDEINASMSQITGVPLTNAAVTQTYGLVKQQLPTVESLGTFLASHQTGIAQLAIEYCNELVNDGALRAAFFPGLDVNASAGAYFSSQGNRDLLSTPLLARAVGQNLATQPTNQEITDELNALIARLTAGASATAPGRVAVVAKAACAAVLGSGVMELQ